MSAPRYAAITAKLLGKHEPPSPQPSLEARARAIAHIELALAQKAKKRRFVRVALASLACAAGLAGLWLGHARQLAPTADAAQSAPVTATLQPTGSGVRLLTSSGSEALQPGSALPQGGRLVADAEGGATLHLSTGTEISVEHGAALSFDSAGATEQFELSAGSMRAHVAKLGAGQRFIVKTPDSEVEVRGTIFQVSVVNADPSCGVGVRTRVQVSEGSVEVRAPSGTFWVHPGETWPQGCPSSTAASAAPRLPEQPVGERARVPSQRKPSEAVVATPAALGSVAAPSSSLAEQNDLFTAAVAARRSGDTNRALSKLGELSARFPSSAFAEAVAAERFRALRRQSQAAALTAAREYLARYPQGFARGEAESILGAP